MGSMPSAADFAQVCESKYMIRFKKVVCSSPNLYPKEFFSKFLTAYRYKIDTHLRFFHWEDRSLFIRTFPQSIKMYSANS